MRFQFGSTLSWHTMGLCDLCCFTGFMVSCTKGKHLLYEIVCAWSPVPKETQEVKWNSLASRLGSVLPSEITLKPRDVCDSDVVPIGRQTCQSQLMNSENLICAMAGRYSAGA